MGTTESPGKRMAAHAVVRDDDGRVLLVEPTYEPGWILPGGAVEADESPRAACARELTEELGASLPVGRLLCLEWHGPEPRLTEALMFVYDGGTIPATTSLRLPADELASSRWVEPASIGELVADRLGRRIRAALDALATEVLVEMENGKVR